MKPCAGFIQRYTAGVSASLRLSLVAVARICLLSSVLAASAQTLADSSDQNLPKEDAYRDGLKHFNAGRYSSAVGPLEKFLGEAKLEDSQRLMAEKALGFSQYFLGQYKSAVPHLERAANLDASDSEILYTLGVSLLNLRDAARARGAFGRVFHVDADSAACGLLVARLMMRERMEDLAQVELERIIRLEPELPELHFLLGELALFRGDVDRAVTNLTKEIQINPGYSMSYYRLGDAFSRKGSWRDAEAALQQAIWLNPDFSSPYILMGKVFEQQGKLAAAEGMLGKALSMDPNNASAHYLMGTILKKLNRPTEAAKQFEIYRSLKR